MSRDPSVQQIMRETLQSLEDEKAYDTNLNALVAMWGKEKGGNPAPIPSAWYEQGIQHGHQHQLLISQQQQIQQYYEQQHRHNHPQSHNHQPIGPEGQYFSRSRTSKRSKILPPQHELVGRLEEARTTAKLLMQVVQSTPPVELLGNDLVREFAGRAQSAQRSIQGYINCENPAPDDSTLQTLVETNEQLSLAMSKHQRAMLTARRIAGQGASAGGNGNGNAWPALHPHDEEPNRHYSRQQQQQQPLHNSVRSSDLLSHEQQFYTPTETAIAPLPATFTTTLTNANLNPGNATISSVQTSPSFRSASNSTLTNNNSNFSYDVGGNFHGRLTSPFSNNDPSPYSNFYNKNTASAQTRSSNMEYLYSNWSDSAAASGIDADAQAAYAPPTPIAPLRVRKVSKESNGNGNHTGSPNSSKNGNYSPKSHSSVPDTAGTSPTGATNMRSTSSTLISKDTVASPSSIDRSVLVSPIRPPSPSEMYSRTKEDPFSDENAVPSKAPPALAPAPAPAVTAPVPTHAPAPALRGDGLRRFTTKDVGSSGSSSDSSSTGAITVAAGDGGGNTYICGNAFANRNRIENGSKQRNGSGSRGSSTGRHGSRNDAGYGNENGNGNKRPAGYSEDERYAIVNPVESEAVNRF